MLSLSSPLNWIGDMLVGICLVLQPIKPSLSKPLLQRGGGGNGDRFKECRRNW